MTDANKTAYSTAIMNEPHDDGFEASDFADAHAALMATSGHALLAAMSNNLNVILAALARCKS